ncbi:MAG: PPE family protein [Mycobacteriaceae bacterium]|nr:PPE family protein [Mycobacteriaceae bacterium]
MNFLVLPPEINSARLFGGEGPTPMLAAAASWDGLAAELGSTAASFGDITSGLAGSSWQGPASVAMVNAATPYTRWLNTAANQAAGTATQARVVASAYETALATAVPPLAITTNRAQLVSLVTTNLFGQNAPAIAAIETHYEQMWAQDVATMATYHGQAAAAAEQLTPWPHLLRNFAGLLNGSPAAAAGTALSSTAAAAAAILPPSIGDAIEAFYLMAQPWVEWGVNVAAWAVGYVPWVGWLAPQINFLYYLWQPIFQSLLFNTIDFLDGTTTFSQAVANIVNSTQESINQFIINEALWIRGFFPPAPPISPLG